MNRSAEILEFVRHFRLKVHDLDAAERKHLSRLYPGDERVTANGRQAGLKYSKPATTLVQEELISRRNRSNLVTQQFTYVTHLVRWENYNQFTGEIGD